MSSVKQLTTGQLRTPCVRTVGDTLNICFEQSVLQDYLIVAVSDMRIELSEGDFIFEAALYAVEIIAVLQGTE